MVLWVEFDNETLVFQISVPEYHSRRAFHQSSFELRKHDYLVRAKSRNYKERNVQSKKRKAIRR